MPNSTVEEYMRSPAITISAEAGLDRALMIMQTQHIRHLPVVDENHDLAGIITSGNLRMHMTEDKSQSDGMKGYFLPALTKVRKVMVTDVHKARVDTTMVEAALQMCDLKIGALPVVDSTGKKVLGIITETDMLRLFAKMMRK
jgi:acetoin utilization protein AcuB